MSILNSYGNLGAALARAGRGARARPYLEHASYWGNGDSSKQLADLFKGGAGVPADPAKAESLRKLAEGQTMKRFTVPTEFDGIKSPFNVYVRAWPAEYFTTMNLPGIEDQVRWVKEARGGVVPQDVRESFIKLQKIATENNVSFPELTVYALAAATDPTTNATQAEVAAITAEMKREHFARNPEIDSDSAGVALKGYDPVSYQTGSAVSGKAGIFALWNGAIWLFSSEQNRTRFLADPERFAPAFGGYCATCLSLGSRTSADPLIFAISDGRLYLFSTQDRRKEWLDTPATHRTAATEKWAEFRQRSTAPASSSKLGTMIGDALASK
jgi:YHS domain-containing protein